ncbi:uncharacterized protein LOC116180404 isoform X2 [Photinus pyralis]|uniref:uncharacterized protein LOC116180404 isoform X2 n=1 Tax=Photinus pyralis TaxID=7054 RepID=UPI001266FD3B|nr:uncharacterized protein LOC116180404 isoform X2 [Photinus pyralis]
MGSCMGRCTPCSDTASKFFGFSNHDFANLIDESSYEGNQSCFLLRIFNKRKEHKAPKPVLEFVEGIFNPVGDSYCRLNESHLPSSSSYNSRDIPMQCLDVRALMAHTTTSTPASSLDLEWEHEALPPSVIGDPSTNSWAILPEECTESSTQHIHGCNSDWSRVSSADSLEWDNVQNSLHASPPISDVDTDTQLLLGEIERLTSEALKETGQNLIS